MSKANEAQVGGARVKRGMAEMLKGGVIMDVVNVEQAKIAEDAGAVAVMALERVPADIRAQGGVSRMSDPDMIEKIQAAVSIPVMAKVRIGHFAEAHQQITNTILISGTSLSHSFVALQILAKRYVALTKVQR